MMIYTTYTALMFLVSIYSFDKDFPKNEIIKNGSMEIKSLTSNAFIVSFYI